MPTTGPQGVTYVIFDQAANDAARNRLFVVAILLGTAAASLIAAMQSLLHAREERKGQPPQTGTGPWLR